MPPPASLSGRNQYAPMSAEILSIIRLPRSSVLEPDSGLWLAVKTRSTSHAARLSDLAAKMWSNATMIWQGCHGCLYHRSSKLFSAEGKNRLPGVGKPQHAEKRNRQNLAENGEVVEQESHTPANHRCLDKIQHTHTTNFDLELCPVRTVFVRGAGTNTACPGRT